MIGERTPHDVRPLPRTPYGLQVSLIQTRREGGKVRHDHIAGLDANTVPASPADCIAFWQRLHDRLSALSNRIVDEQSKTLVTVDERIPMPTPDELRDVQLLNAKADQRFWEGLRSVHTDTIEGHKGVIAAAARITAALEENIKAPRGRLSVSAFIQDQC
jgi:hypothetical protein